MKPPNPTQLGKAYAAHYMHAYSQSTSILKVPLTKEPTPSLYFYRMTMFIANIASGIEKLEKVDASPRLIKEERRGGSIAVDTYRIGSRLTAGYRVLNRLAIVAQCYQSEFGILLDPVEDVQKSRLEDLLVTPWPDIHYTPTHAYLENAPLFMYSWLKKFNPECCDVKIPSEASTVPTFDDEDDQF